LLILASILAIFVYGMIAATLGTILPGFSTRFSMTLRENGQIAFSQAMACSWPCRPRPAHKLSCLLSSKQFSPRSVLFLKSRAKWESGTRVCAWHSGTLCSGSPIATALGLVVASGWLRLAVSSRLIGSVAGSTPDDYGGRS
jgi:hypothetical protein